MKKVFFTLFCFFVCITISNETYAQAQKKVLFEHFTNGGCGPCAQQNPIFDEFYLEHSEECNHISYHTSGPWPNDPLYTSAKDDINSRSILYSVSGVPSIVANGEYAGGPASIDEGDLNKYSEGGSPIDIKVEETGDNTTRQVNVEITSVGSLSGSNLKLFVAVVERHVDFAEHPDLWPSGQSPNKETYATNVFRMFLPNKDGETFTPAPNGQSVTHDFSYNIGSDWKGNSIYVVAFVQNMASKQVIQSGSSYDWSVAMDIKGNTFIKKNGGDPATFETEVDFGENDPEILKFDVETNAPNDWTHQLVTPDGTVTANFPVTIDFTLINERDVKLKVTPGTTKGFYKYSLIMSSKNSPDLFKRYSFFVNNGTVDLIVSNIPEFNPLYVAGLEYAGNDRYGALSAEEFITAGQQGALNSVANVYYNVAYNLAYPALTDDMVDVLAAHLDGGGNLMICGQDIGWDNFSGHQYSYGTDKTRDFYTNYIKAKWLNRGDSQTGTVATILGEEVFGGMGNFFLFAPYGNDNSGLFSDVVEAASHPDEIEPIGNDATTIFLLDNKEDRIGGIRVDNGKYRLVYTTVSVEQMSGANPRLAFMKACHDWFYEVVNVGIFDKQMQDIFSGQNYPNPADEQTHISFVHTQEPMVFTLMDISGKVIQTQNIAIGQQSLMLNTKNLPNGTYIYQINNNKGAFDTNKLVIIH